MNEPSEKQSRAALEAQLAAIRRAIETFSESPQEYSFELGKARSDEKAVLDLLRQLP